MFQPAWVDLCARGVRRHRANGCLVPRTRFFTRGAGAFGWNVNMGRAKKAILAQRFLVLRSPLFAKPSHVPFFAVLPPKTPESCWIQGKANRVNIGSG